MSGPREALIADLRKLLDGTITADRLVGVIEDAIGQLQMGPTGEFTEGKLNENDRGAIVVGMRPENGKVILSFGVPVDWLGFSPSQARHIAAGLLQAANVATAQQQPRRTDGQEANGQGNAQAAAIEAPPDPYAGKDKHYDPRG